MKRSDTTTTTFESILTHASQVQLCQPADKHMMESKKFEHQVAGHFNEVILSLSRTKILKPIIKSNLFLRELQIYEKAQQLQNHSNKKLSLITYMCQYYGVYVDKDSNSSEYNGLYLILENLVYGFSKPCICDIKMGTQTFEPSADLEKKQRRIAKFKYQEQFGFCISGLKVYNTLTDAYITQNKKFGRSATPETIKEMVLSIFHNGRGYRIDALLSILEQLQSIQEYMSYQTDFKFYSSSLLLVYEGDTSMASHCTEEDEEEGDDEEEEDDSVTDLSDNNNNNVSTSSDQTTRPLRTICKMIDFAHTLENDENSSDVDPIDRGYLKGLETLISILQDHITSTNTNTNTTMNSSSIV